MYKNRNNIIIKACQLLGEAFDINDPMLYGADDNSSVSKEQPSTENDNVNTVFDVDVANPVCPCCGVRLNIVDTETELTDDNNEIEVMDPSLEPDDDQANDDTYISIDDEIDPEKPDDSLEDTDDEEDTNDEEDSFGEKIEAFDED